MIQQLEYLLALARERHFGRAAAACHVSQPTLSIAIRKLERELGVVVVLRGRRFEGFTEEGARVVTWAHRIIAERDELLADVERMRGGLSATARLGAVPTAVPAAPLVTSRFLAEHPDASVRVETLSSREISHRLADFEIDAGLTYLDDETPPGTHRIPLYRERYLLVAPEDQPLIQQPVVSWADAARLPLCALTTAMRNRRIIDANMAAAGARFTPVVEADTVGALYAHMTELSAASIVAHPWLHAFGVPPGHAVSPMIDTGPRHAVGFIALEPNSIVAHALTVAASNADIAATLNESLKALLVSTSFHRLES